MGIIAYREKNKQEYINRFFYVTTQRPINSEYINYEITKNTANINLSCESQILPTLVILVKT